MDNMRSVVSASFAQSEGSAALGPAHGALASAAWYGSLPCPAPPDGSEFCSLQSILHARSFIETMVVAEGEIERCTDPFAEGLLG